MIRRWTDSWLIRFFIVFCVSIVLLMAVLFLVFSLTDLVHFLPRD